MLVLNDAGSLKSRNLHGPGVDQLLAEEHVSNGAVTGVYWTLADNLGSIRDVVTLSDNGTPNDPADDLTTLVNHLAYDSFGQITHQSDLAYTPRQTYTGREYDHDTNLYYYRARWYDPRTGQFLSPDPLGFAAGDANLSRYVGNNPTNGRDPSGLIWSYPVSGVSWLLGERGKGTYVREAFDWFEAGATTFDIARHAVEKPIRSVGGAWSAAEHAYNGEYLAAADAGASALVGQSIVTDATLGVTYRTSRDFGVNLYRNCELDEGATGGVRELVGAAGVSALQAAGKNMPIASTAWNIGESIYGERVGGMNHGAEVTWEETRYAVCEGIFVGGTLAAPFVPKGSLGLSRLAATEQSCVRSAAPRGGGPNFSPAGPTKHAFRLDLNSKGPGAYNGLKNELPRNSAGGNDFSGRSAVESPHNQLTREYPPTRNSGTAPNRGAPTNLGPVGSKAPRQVTPGVRELEGHHIDDLGRSQPWRAHYDEHGRMIGRTDYNAGNRAAGIPDIHHERWEYNAQFPLGRKVENHIPGEFPQ